MNNLKLSRIGIFCGSNSGTNPAYTHAGREMGSLLAKDKIGLVYGGGNVGLMGEIANAALAAGGDVIGVIPHALALKELAHNGLTDLRVVDTMHERKAMMAQLSDAFIALPGGFGTLDEFCEILTWAQLGLHSKPCAMLNVAGYFDPLLALFDTAARERFLPAQHRAMLRVGDDPRALLEEIFAYKPPEVEKWISRKEV
jgi:uncharacterized protein (TIGR00730 family)